MCHIFILNNSLEIDFLILINKNNCIIFKVVNYIGERSRTDIQLIVISLKEEMYNKADALIGIYPRSTAPCIASGILHYDLENFNTNPDEQ
jgi:hypothetical protein